MRTLLKLLAAVHRAWSGWLLNQEQQRYAHAIAECEHQLLRLPSQLRNLRAAHAGLAGQARALRLGRGGTVKWMRRTPTTHPIVHDNLQLPTYDPPQVFSDCAGERESRSKGAPLQLVHAAFGRSAATHADHAHKPTGRSNATSQRPHRAQKVHRKITVIHENP